MEISETGRSYSLPDTYILHNQQGKPTAAMQKAALDHARGGLCAAPHSPSQRLAVLCKLWLQEGTFPHLLSPCLPCRGSANTPAPFNLF